MQRPDYDSEFSGPLSDVDQRRPKVSEQPPGRAEPDFKRAARGVESLIRVEEHFDASRGRNEGHKTVRLAVGPNRSKRVVACRFSVFAD